MSAVALVARSVDGFVIGSSNRSTDKALLQDCKMLFHHHNMIENQTSFESGNHVYHFQKGGIVSLILVTPISYPTVEAFSRIQDIQEEFIKFVGVEKIKQTSAFLVSASEKLHQVVNAPFDGSSSIALGEEPPRRNISEILGKIKGQPFGFSDKAIKKRTTVVLEWKEITLLVPLTLIGFFKSLVAMNNGGFIAISSNFLSTGVSFFLVFICVHGLLTTKRLILSSFLLLVLTYGTTMTSLTSIVFNGVFALLTLANVAFYYLKPLRKSEKV